MSATIQDLRDVADPSNGFEDLILSPGECRQLASQFDKLTKRLEAAEQYIVRLESATRGLREHWDLGNTLGAETRRRVLHTDAVLTDSPAKRFADD